MSYILEALKKSDRERRQGEIPGLQSDHGKRPDPGKKRHKQSVWAGIAAGIIVLAALAAFIYFWGTRKNDAALQEKITALEKSLGQLQEQPGQSGHEAGQPTAETAARTTADKTKSHPEELQSPAVSRQDPFEPTAETTEANEEWAVNNEQPTGREETMPNPEDAADAMAQEAASSAAKPAELETASQQTDSLPLIQDLPANIRQRLPPLTLAGHVFSENAAKRMIIINNRICREGDMVEDGLFLDRIIWEGVVLRYQEIRFRMNLL